jgi:Flp pilus assembly protein TadG
MERCMKRLFRQFIKADDGLAAVEYALFVPILSLTFMAMVDYGMFLHHKMMMQELSRAAVEYIVQGGNEADIEANVFENSAVYTAATADGREVETYTDRTCECRDLVQTECTASCGIDDFLRTFYAVTVRSTYTPILPYPGLPESLEVIGYTTVEYNG